MKKFTNSIFKVFLSSAIVLSVGCTNDKEKHKEKNNSKIQIIETSNEDSYFENSVIDSDKKEYNVINYLQYEGKSLADAIKDFDNLEIDGALPLNYRGRFGDSSKSANPQERVHFLYELAPGTEITDYSKITIYTVWIENPDVMNNIINQSVNYESEKYYVNINGVNYDYYACQDFLEPMGLYIEKPTEPPTSPLSSNSYGIYVTGNTELARLAGNTLIDKASWGGLSGNASYGYILTNGNVYNDVRHTYSDISVSVNEDPKNPNTGHIVINATRCTNNIYYPLRITVDWKATDYGDYHTFTWSNTDIYG